MAGAVTRKRGKSKKRRFQRHHFLKGNSRNWVPIVSNFFRQQTAIRKCKAGKWTSGPIKALEKATEKLG